MQVEASKRRTSSKPYKKVLREWIRLFKPQFGSFRRDFYTTSRSADVIRRTIVPILENDTHVPFILDCVHLSDFAHEGCQDVFMLFLCHVQLAIRAGRKVEWDDLYENKFSPLNQSLTCGLLAHVPSVLELGYTIQYTEVLYQRLLTVAIYHLVFPYHQLNCLDALMQHPNRRRLFHILLVIRTFIYNEKHPRYYSGCDEALRLVFQRAPHLPITSREFHVLFAPFLSDTRTLCAYYCRYRDNVICGHTGPFSLMHYSRCEVRRLMHDRMSLPEGVDSLHVPNEVKSYLLFQ